MWILLRGGYCKITFNIMSCTPETAKLAAMDPIINTFNEKIIAGTLHLHMRLGWAVGVQTCLGAKTISLSSGAFTPTCSFAPPPVG